MRPANLVINGRFLTQRTTGVQRYAREMVHALGELDNPDVELELICPPGAERLRGLRQIRQNLSGVGGGQAWEQLQLPWLAAGRPLLCLCNLAPLVAVNRAVVIHDAAVFDRAWHRFALRALVASRAQIITVSQFSRGRLAKALNVQPEQIEVVGEAADHVARIEPDPSLAERLGLGGRPFVLAIGSLHPNKNIGTLEAAMKDPRLDPPARCRRWSVAIGLWRRTTGGLRVNVHYTGYATDE